MIMMNRWRIPLWSIADSFSKSKSIKYGQRNVAGESGFFPSFSTLTGDNDFGYGEEPTAKSIQQQIVDALNLGERGRASSMLSDLGHSSNNNLLRANDFVDILTYCVSSPDPLFAMETWRIMEEKEIRFNNHSCLLMVRSLCRGGYLEEAYNLIVYIGENHSINPTLAVYNKFLGACSKMCNVILANKCLDLMAHRMLGKNETTYMHLLKLAVCQQNLSAVYQILKEYNKFYSPSIWALQNFIQSFTRLGDLNSAYETLQYMVSLVLQGNTYISSTVEGWLCSSRLDIPIPSKVELSLQRFGLKEINEQFVHSKADNSTNNIGRSMIPNPEKEVESVRLDKLISIPAMKLLKSSFGDVIHACAQARNRPLAEQLMLQMQKLRVQPSSHTYDGYVRATVYMCEGHMSKGIEVLKRMQQRDLKPYRSTLATVSAACSKNLELDLAEALLDQISNYQDPRPFNAFLRACDTTDGPERAIRVWAKMMQLHIKPDISTYALLFSLFGNVNAPYERGNMLSQVDCAKRINAILMDMAKNGVRHNKLSMKNLLKSLGAEGMIRELIHYLQMEEDLYCSYNISFGTPICNVVLHSLVEARETQLATKMFQKMKSNGLRLDAATYTIMIDCCSNIRCYKTASALISMMLRDGFYPEIETYTALIKVLMERGNFKEALNVLNRASSEEIQPDVLLYNTIIRKAMLKRRIDVIELLVEQMHREKIKPDSKICNHVFSTYVKSHFYNTAMEALQVLSMRMICEGDDDCLQQKKAEFEEDFILCEDEEAESRILELFVRGEEELTVALLSLRWCAILGYPISWSPNESLWARRLSANYDRHR